MILKHQKENQGRLKHEQESAGTQAQNNAASEHAQPAEGESSKSQKQRQKQKQKQRNKKLLFDVNLHFFNVNLHLIQKVLTEK